jgi:AcrR family transcriptional regulator
MSPRAYKSQLREKQAEQTRERIVDALFEQVLDTQRNDFAIAEVAERAGVSERTVYRHFPTRDDLIRAVDERYQNLPAPEPPKSVSDFPRHVGDLYGWFAENEELVEAAHVAGIGRELHQRARARRGEMARRVMDEMFAPLPKRERKILFAVVRSMFGSAIWRAMRDEAGLTNDEAREAATWVANLLTKDISRRIRAAKKKEGGK